MLIREPGEAAYQQEQDGDPQGDVEVGGARAEREAEDDDEECAVEAKKVTVDTRPQGEEEDEEGFHGRPEIKQGGVGDGAVARPDTETLAVRVLWICLVDNHML